MLRNNGGEVIGHAAKEIPTVDTHPLKKYKITTGWRWEQTS